MQLVEVTIISARDLKNVKFGCFGGKMSPFAVAWTTSGGTNSPRKTTPPSTKGGRDPTWNSKQTFICREDSFRTGLENLAIELWHKSFIKKKLLGTVTMPLSSEYQSSPSPMKLSCHLARSKES
ncbi:hypothetical protein M758_2G131600 [Ceratodon purpureus]|nr:hypothetical protein M758_2G131600 [Ceratodon purpureus]